MLTLYISSIYSQKWGLKMHNQVNKDMVIDFTAVVTNNIDRFLKNILKLTRPNF